MTPIGKTTFFEEGGEWLSHGPDLVERVGSRLACEKEFCTWYCPRDETEISVPVTCENARLCARCSIRWSFQEARKVAWRLDHVKRRKVFRHLSPRHVIVSFAVNIDPLTDWGYRVALKRAWARLKAMGATGGVGIYHPWRHKPRGEAVQGAFWRLSPHTHWIVWGWLEDGQRGDAFVKIPHPKGQDDLVATVAYLLDHCGVQRRRHAVRYYGIASYGLCPGVPRPPKERLAPLCPVCGGEMTPLEGIRDYTSYSYVDQVHRWRWGDVGGALSSVAGGLA